ncbi:hypothetical protein Tco_0743519 [Tanacetum coccineum]
MVDLKFADTHNLVAFLSKPTKSEEFEQIVDFLNANPINYALTVNPTIYSSCIEHFWATIKVKTVNGEVQLQALVDGKRIVITKSTIRRDLQVEDAEGTDCLPNATIFEYAKTTAWNEFSITMASAIICLATNQKFNFSKYIFDSMVKNVDSVGNFLMYPRFVQVFVNQQLGDMSNRKRIYVTPSHTKKIFGNIKRERKGFSRRVTPLFPTMMVQAQEEMSEGLANPTDPHHTPIITQPSTSQPQKKHKPMKPKKKDTQSSGPTDTIAQTGFENVSKTSNDTLFSGEDSIQLKELMDFYTKLQQRVLDLENTKTAQAQEISSLKLRVKRLEKKGGSRTHKLKRLCKVGLSKRVVSYDKASLDLREVLCDDQMFDVSDLAGEEVFVIEQGVHDSKKDNVVSTVGAAQVSTVATTITITPEDITLAQPLHELKTAKPKVKGIAFKGLVETTTTTITISLQQPSQATIQDKGKGKMVKLEPVKKFSKKDQIRIDEELAFKLQAEEEEEERLARENFEANVALIEEWNDIQAKRRKHFAAKRAEEKRNKPLTKAQKRSIRSTYLKNMAGYKHNQLKNKCFDDIQKLFDKEMKRVNIFVDMDIELVEENTKKAEAEIAQVSHPA